MGTNVNLGSQITAWVCFPFASLVFCPSGLWNHLTHRGHYSKHSYFPSYASFEGGCWNGGIFPFCMWTGLKALFRWLKFPKRNLLHDRNKENLFSLTAIVYSLSLCSYCFIITRSNWMYNQGVMRCGSVQQQWKKSLGSTSLYSAFFALFDFCLLLSFIIILLFVHHKSHHWYDK